MPKVKRVFAALKGSKQVPLFINLCAMVLSKMKGNLAFSSPPVDLAVAKAHLDDLDKAEKATVNGPPGAATDRNYKLGIVRGDMRLLKEFVQILADAAGPQAVMIIESAGMTASTKAPVDKAPFAARHGRIPGRVRLDAKASRRHTTYYWQMSADQQQTWSSLPDTQVATTIVDGLTAGALYHFRFRKLTKDGLSDWSAVVSIRAL